MLLGTSNVYNLKLFIAISFRSLSSSVAKTIILLCYMHCLQPRRAWSRLLRGENICIVILFFFSGLVKAKRE